MLIRQTGKVGRRKYVKGMGSAVKNSMSHGRFNLQSDKAEDLLNMAYLIRHDAYSLYQPACV